MGGGNYFDDMRVDLAAAFDKQEFPHARQPVRRLRVRNRVALAAYTVECRLGLREPFVYTGIRRAWFDTFHEYWSNALRGRPLTVADFHALRFSYRCRTQITETLEWGSAAKHLANWAAPAHLSSTFQFVYRDALRPVRWESLPRFLPRGGRVLEYGCSTAPMYLTWRSFYNHVHCNWVLADIPSFPFHYARHVYARDSATSFVTITEDAIGDPLRDVEGGFDLIIAQEVFEHLHAPRQMAEYLTDRLNPGGLLAFDYIDSGEAHGLDTPAGVNERSETLAYLTGRLQMLHGRAGEALAVGRLRP
jgi:SAM-dependent methyltransferase